MVLSFLKSLFGITEEDKEARDLALRVEERARKLSGLPPRPETAPTELKAVLSSVSLLLDRIDEQPKSRAEEKPSPAPPPTQAREPQPPEPPPAPKPVPATAPSPPAHATDGALSVTAKELIKLRDWVLLAKSGDAASNTEALEGIYRKLAQILRKEGVTALEENTAFNEERQQIIDTRPTDDPHQDNVVCDTVRPGYLFNGEIIRPQEVIIFTYEQDSATSRL